VAEMRRLNARDPKASKSIDDLNNAAFIKWKRLKNTEAKVQRKMARKRMGCVGRVDPYEYKMYITHAEKRARNTKKKVRGACVCARAPSIIFVAIHRRMLTFGSGSRAASEELQRVGKWWRCQIRWWPIAVRRSCDSLRTRCRSWSSICPRRSRGVPMLHPQHTATKSTLSTAKGALKVLRPGRAKGRKVPDLVQMRLKISS
jgi:hypothetical protein